MAISSRMYFHSFSHPPETKDETYENNPYRDAAAALVGSLGLIPSINAGNNFVMGEPYAP